MEYSVARALKSRCCLVSGLMLVILSVLNCIIIAFNYSYKPNDSLRFLAIYMFAVISALILNVRAERCATKSSKLFANMLPIMALIYSTTLISVINFENSVLDQDLFTFVVFAGTLLSAIIIFFVYCKSVLLKSIMIVFTVIAILFLAMHLFFLILFYGFGETTVEQSFCSPDGLYLIQVISSDQGALGGSTYVCISRVNRDIALPCGSLCPVNKTIWSGDWGVMPVFVWKDDRTLVINEIEYVIEDY